MFRQRGLFAIWCLLSSCFVINSVGAVTTQEGPYVPDADTGLLLRLDGYARDASDAENHGQVRGSVAWAEGRFGKSLSLDGRGGLVIEGSGATYVGRRSWTIEYWFRPRREQPLSAVLLASGWGHERLSYIEINEGRRLVACFSGGQFSGAVSSLVHFGLQQTRNAMPIVGPIGDLI